jgi:integrase/recombinase XerC/integrase/recombinase XerD
MGTTVRLRPAPEITLGEARDAYLATLDHNGSRGTRRIYAGVLAALTDRFGPGAPISAIAPQAAAAWFRETWGNSAGSTWNVRRAAMHSAAAYWTRQGWLTGDPFAMIERRRVTEDRDRALSHAEVERLLTDEKTPLRERLLWRLLYESAARSAEVLRLNVEDLDLPNRRARVRRKGGAMDVIVWQTATARLLPRYLKGRTSGPLFVTDRRARVELPPGDLDERGRARLSYERAEELFRTATGGKTLHQLRHSALSHDADDGTSTPMLMARSGHTSVRSLAKYARVSAEALARHQAERDPARRR